MILPLALVLGGRVASKHCRSENRWRPRYVSYECREDESNGHEAEKNSDKDAAAAMPGPSLDLVQTAIGAGSFKTLAAALEAADLVDTLKGEGPFTVFAPTDEAFLKLPEGALDDLLKEENKSKLKDLLTYHVVPGRVMAADFLKLTAADAVNEKKLSVGLNVNGATVTQADIIASNGVIHVIDSVLQP